MEEDEIKANRYRCKYTQLIMNTYYGKFFIKDIALKDHLIIEQINGSIYQTVKYDGHVQSIICISDDDVTQFFIPLYEKSKLWKAIHE